MYAVNRATYSEESSELAAERNSNKEFVWPFDLVLRVREYDGTFAALNLTYDIAMYAGNTASTLSSVGLAYPHGGAHCGTSSAWCGLRTKRQRRWGKTSIHGTES